MILIKILILYLEKTIIIIKIGNSYLQYDITVRKGDNSNFVDDNADVIRLVNNAFAYCFKNASIQLLQEDRNRNK